MNITLCVMSGHYSNNLGTGGISLSLSVGTSKQLVLNNILWQVYSTRRSRLQYTRRRTFMELIPQKEVRMDHNIRVLLGMVKRRPYRAGKAISACSLAQLDGHFHEK